MAISSGIAIKFKEDCLEGVHHFSSATFKMALYTSLASLSNGTSVYLTSAEVANGNGYTTGGAIVTVLDVTIDGSIAIVDFNSVSWTSATFTATGCLIYNDTQSDKTVAVIDFGGDKTATNGTFTVQMPAAAAATAIVRLA
ncbi:MAG TPA: hypothetical protein DCS66_07865 [Flavobacteriaceae bacterium]|nr:hypothetical protein [Flavobacteriaceae bacterium]|tara:strand:- start:2388 stop:2810 length:423 start_codon:yes stop_codon:yes gene_type:complete